MLRESLSVLRTVHSALPPQAPFVDSVTMSERAKQSASSNRFSERDVEFLDRILQDLFGLGLKLEYCLSVLDDTPDQARTGIEDVVSGLDDISVPIREQIHRLAGSLKLSNEIYC